MCQKSFVQKEWNAEVYFPLSLDRARSAAVGADVERQTTAGAIPQNNRADSHSRAQLSIRLCIFITPLT
jgi:hypothetical protein